MPAKITNIISFINDEDCFKPFLPHNFSPNSIYSPTFFLPNVHFYQSKKNVWPQGFRKKKRERILGCQTHKDLR